MNRIRKEESNARRSLRRGRVDEQISIPTCECPPWTAHAETCNQKGNRNSGTVVADLIAAKQEEEKEAIRLLEEAVRKEIGPVSQQASSSSTAGAPPPNPIVPCTMDLKFVQLSGADVNITPTIRNLKEARDAVAKALKVGSRVVRFATDDGTTLYDFCPTPADKSTITVAVSTQWTGEGVVNSYYHHCTDAEMRKEYLPLECFDSAQAHEMFIHQNTDERGQLNALPMMEWLFDQKIEDAVGDVSWKEHLPAVVTIIETFTIDDDGRPIDDKMKMFKRAGQVGECMHDYGTSNIYRKAGHEIREFLTTKNEVYEGILTTCSPEIQARVMRWITVKRSLSNECKVHEAIGDFFEFVEFYLLAKQRSDLLMSMITNVIFIVYGPADIQKAIAYQNAEVEATETVFMMIDYTSEGRFT